MDISHKGLKIGEKRASVPIIQGGMGVGISLGNLAGNVAKEGGVGIISTAQIGFREPDFDRDAKKANLRAMETELEKARKLAGEGIVGFNIMVATNGYEDYVRRAVEIGADVIISGAGLPVDLPQYVKGSNTAICPIVSTVKSAKVIFKYWDRKYSRVPDLLVIEGPKAGGHLGFEPEQLKTFTDEAYDEEIKGIMAVAGEYARKYEKQIPVVSAGGIDDAEKVQHMLELGADGVQVASRFVTTWECDADIRFKQAYIRSEEKDIRIVKSPVGMPGRAIENDFLRRVEEGERIVHKCHRCLAKCDPAVTPYCITEALIHAAKGEIEQGLLFCGANAWKIKEIQSVSQVINELMKNIA